MPRVGPAAKRPAAETTAPKNAAKIVRQRTGQMKQKKEVLTPVAGKKSARESAAKKSTQTALEVGVV